MSDVNEIKLVILVLSNNADPWNKIENEGIRKTWYKHSQLPKNVSVLFYYGGDEEKIVDDRLFLPYPELLENIGYKTIGAFEYVEENFDYDFLFRTNTSSYVHIENLLKHLSQYEFNKHIYSGFNGGMFASGCGYTLSKKSVQTVINNKDKWNHELIDDVALGTLLNSLNIRNTNASRIDITSLMELPKLNVDLLFKQFHIRCKCDWNRLNDIVIMKHIHDLYSGVKPDESIDFSKKIDINSVNYEWLSNVMLSKLEKRDVLLLLREKPVLFARVILKKLRSKFVIAKKR
ncbi:MAG: hypothetical protein HRU20_05705 [Pseudomonadales bacterium]|nr:hypothetical protein [Pseudomonadales bacterium]